ncbi:MAG: hypothetical protein JSS65_06300 [Armatimonadetes bacterium]|nr:hypothetical protein [Armatimonadota bacterium]
MKSRLNSKLTITEVLATVGAFLAVAYVTSPILAQAKSDGKLGGKISAERNLSLANSMYSAENETFVSEDGVVPFKSVMPIKGGKLSPMARLKPGNGIMGVSTGHGINYHNGPVMTGTIHAYVIWYGAWTASDQSLVSNFISNLGGSAYFNINTTYGDNTGDVSGQLTLAGTTVDTGSQGTKSLTDTKILNIVKSALSTGKFPYDSNGIYLVLTGSNVTKSGFCTQYCGWHTRASINGFDIKYSFVGNPVKCPSSCAAQSPGPNGSVGADGMVSIIAHEVEEAATDPDLNAWYDASGAENADKCAWTFGTTSGASGGKYNVTFGGKNYLVQQNWVNAGTGFCAMHL